jgi:hypothetical protein
MEAGAQAQQPLTQARVIEHRLALNHPFPITFVPSFQKVSDGCDLL